MLLLPSSNRVYNNAASGLAQAELASFNDGVLNNRLRNIHELTIGNVQYLAFDSEPLTQQDIGHLSNLSFVFALFRLHEQAPSPLLQPLTLQPLSHHDSTLLSILKFPGKTNEQFTKLLLNVTAMASSSSEHMRSKRLRVFDPVCGRGTTLNQALMYGYDAAGMEIDNKDFKAYEQFINRWLKENRIKHTSKTVTLKHADKSHAQALKAQLAKDKNAQKNGDYQSVDVVLADTTLADRFFKPGSFDLIVADLPYGVKHGNTTDKRLFRSPQLLLETALPVWSSLLRPGAAIGLAWNTNLAKKPDIAELMSRCGLDVAASTMDTRFKHRVDQAIMRDLIVATRSR